jgi:DNA topoisomerase VI subunit B
MGYASNRTTTTLERTVFDLSRDAEYFTIRELQAKTGQPAKRFAVVALKELVDNGLDAAETAEIAPEICVGVANGRRHLRLFVRDNGPGIPPETVRSILNFQTRTSDKAVYRSPTRGAQGNAWKTILGIAWALGCDQPVTLEARGVRHIIQAGIDPAGALRIQHQAENVPPRPGTRVWLTLPIHGQHFPVRQWIRAFSLFNPHASVRICHFEAHGKQASASTPPAPKIRKTYRPAVRFPGVWSKFLPGHPTSAWWYAEADLARLVFAHIGLARQGSHDLLLRDFVRQFRGLSATAKAAAVCRQLPDVTRLSDFEHRDRKLEGLLRALRDGAKPPSPAVLGAVGKEHFEARFQAWYGVQRFWYRRAEGLIGGVPFIFEAAIAHTHRPGQFFHAVNFSPTFADPLADTYLTSPEFMAYGVGSFLESGHVQPHRQRGSGPHVAAAVHLVCPSLDFLDQGKTRLKIPRAMAKAIGQALWRVSKELYREEERRRKNAARQARADRESERAQRPPKGELKRAVATVLVEALAEATGDASLPVSAHTLFYVVRRRIQALTSKELTSDYFEQKLLPAYQQRHGTAPYTVYYEARGTLYEPHTGVEVPLGTREVEAYQFPAHLYDKILFVEKKGLWPVLQAARLAERYDMAIVAGEGYATEACRVLFANAERGRDYQLFVLHDADPHGYNIARTLREETARMPGHCVDVIDLGLKLEEALELGLQAEEFTRKKALPQELVLTALEREWFEGRQAGRKSWVARRVELNALIPPELVEYTEQKLLAAGVRGKVIPPEDELPALAEAICRQILGDVVDERLRQLLNAEDLKARVAAELLPSLGLAGAGDWIAAGFAADRSVSWRQAVRDKVGDLLTGHSADIEGIIRAWIHTAVAG